MLGPRRFAGAVVLVSLVLPATAVATVTAETHSPTVWLFGHGSSGVPLDLALSGDGDAITIVSRNTEEFGLPPFPLTPGSDEPLCPGPDPSQVTCTPAAGDYYPKLLGVSTILSYMDDRLDATGLHGVDVSVSAGPGSDVITGGDDDDALNGWTGVDELHGGPGNDLLWMNDHPREEADPDSPDSDCGPGDRDLVRRDLEDPPLSELDGCELEIPAFYAPPTVAGTPAVGAPLSVSETGATGTSEPAQYRWRSCDGAGCGGVVGTDPTYVPTAADAGRTVTVDVSRSVTGGPELKTYSAEATARSAPIAAAPAAPAASPSRDVIAPTVALRAVRAKVRKGRMTLVLGTASETGAATLQVRGAARARLRLVAGRLLTARVRLTGTTRRALRRHRRLRLRATLTARDAAGNVGRQRFVVIARA